LKLADKDEKQKYKIKKEKGIICEKGKDELYARARGSIVIKLCEKKNMYGESVGVCGGKEQMEKKVSAYSLSMLFLFNKVLRNLE